MDREHDLALLRIAGAPLPAVTFGDSEAVRDGQSIAFTGFPDRQCARVLSGHAPRHHCVAVADRASGATTEQLDARVVRSLKAGPFVLFQLDATAYPGHSGSPLYDAETGEVIGIVNMGFLKGTKDAAVGQPSGISFAVPVQLPAGAPPRVALTGVLSRSAPRGSRGRSTAEEQAADRRILEQFGAGADHRDLAGDDDATDVGELESRLRVLLDHHDRQALAVAQVAQHVEYAVDEGGLETDATARRPGAAAVA